MHFNTEFGQAHLKLLTNFIFWGTGAILAPDANMIHTVYVSARTTLIILST